MINITAFIKAFPLAWGAGFLSLILAVAIYFRMGAVEEKRDELFNLEREIGVIQANTREGLSMDDELSIIQDMVDSIDGRLVDESQIAINNGYFYERVADSPVNISDVVQLNTIVEKRRLTPEDIWALNHYSITPFEFQISGLLTDILNFLYDLKRSERLIHIRSFELQLDTQREPGYMLMEIEVNMLGKPILNTAG